MVKVYGPMMSLDASGTLGKAVTFSKWKGRNYVRERVIPSNPKSGGQVGRRAMFKFLTQEWDGLSDANKATYQPLADQLVALPFNAFVSYNMKLWHNFLTPSQDIATAKAGTGSDNVITAAVWEENRIKITLTGSALAETWGVILFASLTGTFTPSVGNAIIVDPETTIAAHDIFWTPPSVAVWYLDSVTFSVDGAQETEGGESTATP